MSGTNLKYLIFCRVFFCACYAVTWNIGSIMPTTYGKDPQSCVFHPAIFPDTLCFASSWSNAFKGFEIHEGMIYGSSGKFDISVITQYHRLMSNHQLNIGFPVLNENNIKAGLQLHYTLSALHGVGSKHKGSCSGGLIISPTPDWQVSLYSMHLLRYPRDSTEHMLEAKLGAISSIWILPSFKLSVQTHKMVNTSWRLLIGAAWQPIQILSMGLKYELNNNNFFFDLALMPGNWRIGLSLYLHRYLGLTQQIMIAYVR